MSESQLRYDTAMRDIRKGLTFENGGPAAEARAASAYADMVRNGEAPPLKHKYRVGRRLKKVR